MRIKMQKRVSFSFSFILCMAETNLTFIYTVLNASSEDALSYNPSVPDIDRLQYFTRANIPFSCDCIMGEFLGHIFQYQLFLLIYLFILS